MGGYVDLSGVRTWYAATGAGEPLVLIHPGGGGADSRVFGPNIDALAARFRTFTPERRGHGRTPDVEGPITFEAMAQDTIRFLEQVVGGTARLMGSSDGPLLPFGNAGRPDTLSAQTVVDRGKSLVDVYGMEGGESPLGKVRCPFLAILGTKEPQIGSPDDLETLKRNSRSSARADAALIEGADHWYHDREEAVARAIYGWLGKLP